MTCQHKHVSKLSGGGSEPEWVAVCKDCGAPLGSNVGGYYVLPEHEPALPPPGSWASVARLMAQTDPVDGDPDFWDRWKDEMKERDM